MTRRLSLVFMYAGIAGTVFGASKIHASVIASPTYDFTASFRFRWAVAFCVLISAAAYAVGLPDVPRRARQVLAASVGAVMAGTAGIAIAQSFVGDAVLPRFVLVGAGVALVPVLSLSNLVARGGNARARALDRIVVIGAQEDSTSLSHQLDDEVERPGQVVAVLTPDEAVPSAVRPTPIRAAVEAHGATLVVLDREAQSSQVIVDQVALLHESGIRIRTLSLFYEQWLGKLPIGELERVSLMFDIGEVHRQRYGRFKRLLDVIVAIALLPALAVAMPLVTIANRFGNRGPLFYSQPRVGKSGVVFQIYKFRTMRKGASTEWTGENDGRVTPVGRFLRATHVDELPQALNILRGDLSLVGPRPEQPHYVDELEAKLPYYQLRHLVQPGLTGWAQVKQGYARSDTDALEKLQYEFYYLRRQAFAVDLRIIARTLRAVVPVGGPQWR
ncbi:MAG: sugar transferase [Actinomycetota bacterium]